MAAMSCAKISTIASKIVQIALLTQEDGNVNSATSPRTLSSPEEYPHGAGKICRIGRKFIREASAFCIEGRSGAVAMAQRWPNIPCQRRAWRQTGVVSTTAATCRDLRGRQAVILQPCNMFSSNIRRACRQQPASAEYGELLNGTQPVSEVVLSPKLRSAMGAPRASCKIALVTGVRSQLRCIPSCL